MLLIDMKFRSKLLQMFFMENLSFSEPHLHKTYFKKYIYIQTIFKKIMFEQSKHTFQKSSGEYAFQKNIEHFQNFRFSDMEHFFKDDPIIVLAFFEPFW